MFNYRYSGQSNSYIEQAGVCVCLCVGVVLFTPTPFISKFPLFHHTNFARQQKATFVYFVVLFGGDGEPYPI